MNPTPVPAMVQGWRLIAAPPSASTFAGPVDAIFYSWVGIYLLVTVGVFGMLTYLCVKYRKGAKVERGNYQNHPLEWFWTLSPLVVFMGFFVWGATQYFIMRRPPANSMHVYLTAKQWMWKFEHPEGAREIDELHVPVGRPVELTMISQDVIHSFFVPAFRLHQDILPDRYLHTWFEATRTGRFRLYCSQYCGTYHAEMDGWIDVMAPAAYARWLRTEGGTPSMAEEGEKLFSGMGCSGCHGPNSTVHAPRFPGRFGQLAVLRDGRILRIDDAYLRDCILQPADQRVAGYQPIMPSFAGQLTEEQVMELVAYIESLANVPPAEAQVTGPVHSQRSQP